MAPRSLVWEEFTVVDGCPVCKYCGSSLSTFSSGTRLEGHIRSCRKAPQRLKELFSSAEDSSMESSPTQHSPELKRPRADGVDRSESQSSGGSQTNLYAVRITKEFIETATDKLARMIYGCNVPFHIVEHPAFVDFVSLINPAFGHRLPSRKEVAGSLLSRHFEKTKEEIIQLVEKSECVCVVSDCWSNIRHQSVVNFMVTFPEQPPVLLDARFTEADHHTAENMAIWIGDIIRKIGPKKVVALVTDNASTMLSCHEILQRSFPHLQTIGCLAHGIHLVCKGVLKVDFAQRTLEPAMSIIKRFCHSNLLSAKLANAQKQIQQKELSLFIPRYQRWGTVLGALCRLNRCKQSLRELCIADERLSTREVPIDVHALILQDVFWEKIDYLISLLRPMISLLFRLEGDTPLLYLVFPEYRKMMEFVSHRVQTTEDRAILDSLLDKRFAFSYRRIMVFSAVLDPFSVLMLSKSNTLEISRKCIGQICGSVTAAKVIEQFSDYLLRRNFFSGIKSMWSATHLSPLDWWRLNCDSRDVQELFVVAVRVLSIPATSACSERNWWKFSLVHSDGRARLGNETVLKLVTMHAAINRDKKKRRPIAIDLEDPTVQNTSVTGSLEYSAEDPLVWIENCSTQSPEEEDPESETDDDLEMRIRPSTEYLEDKEHLQLEFPVNMQEIADSLSS